MGIKLRWCSPRANILLHQAWLLPRRIKQTHKATTEINKIWEPPIKLKARIAMILFLAFLPPRFLSEHHFKYMSCQQIALATLACMEGRDKEDIRKEREEREERLGEKRWLWGGRFPWSHELQSQGHQPQKVRGKQQNLQEMSM